MCGKLKDVVIIKTTGIFRLIIAHAVDDHLMRTTHVIRGEGSPLPIHVELSEKLGFELPVYCHRSADENGEDGNKRKLSKRKDPRAFTGLL